jgi:AcrR family transcriptional regulator
MAPTRRHTRETILNGSFNFVREKGFEKISARRIANYINASTAPIYSNFSSMEELEVILEEKAVDTLKESLMNEMGKENVNFLDIPLKYIEFAFDEANLFNLISKSKKSMKTMRGNLEQEVYVKMQENMKKSKITTGLEDTQLQDIIFKTWLHSHGIAAFLDRDVTKEENLKYAKTLLEDSVYSSIYSIKNNFSKEGL